MCLCVCVCVYSILSLNIISVCAHALGGGVTEELRNYVAACHALRSCKRVARNRLSSSGVLDHDVDLDELD